MASRISVVRFIMRKILSHSAYNSFVSYHNRNEILRIIQFRFAIRLDIIKMHNVEFYKTDITRVNKCFFISVNKI